MYSFYTQPQKHISNAKIIFPEWGAPLESYLHSLGISTIQVLMQLT